MSFASPKASAYPPRISVPTIVMSADTVDRKTERLSAKSLLLAAIKSTLPTSPSGTRFYMDVALGIIKSGSIDSDKTSETYYTAQIKDIATGLAPDIVTKYLGHSPKGRSSMRHSEIEAALIVTNIKDLNTDLLVNYIKLANKKGVPVCIITVGIPEDALDPKGIKTQKIFDGLIKLASRNPGRIQIKSLPLDDISGERVAGILKEILPRAHATAVELGHRSPPTISTNVSAFLAARPEVDLHTGGLFSPTSAFSPKGAAPTVHLPSRAAATRAGAEMRSPTHRAVAAPAPTAPAPQLPPIAGAGFLSPTHSRKSDLLSPRSTRGLASPGPRFPSPEPRHPAPAKSAAPTRLTAALRRYGAAALSFGARPSPTPASSFPSPAKA